MSEIESFNGDEPRTLRILLVLLHPGYVRNYEGALRILLGRGHHVHIAFVTVNKQNTGRLVEQLADDHPNLQLSRVPKAGHGGEVNLCRCLYAIADYARYQHPRYALADGLRDRVAKKVLGNRRRAGILPALVLTLYLKTLGHVTNPWFASWVSTKALKLADRVPASPGLAKWLPTLDVDLVLVSPHLGPGSQEPEIVRAARQARIRTALLVASWDNLTNKGLIKHPLDRVILWNAIQKREAVDLHGIPAERVRLTGAPRFDDWFEMGPSSEVDEFRRRAGLDPTAPYILYLCSSPFIAPDEVPFVRAFIDALRRGPTTLATAGVLVRPHPQNAAQWADADLSDLENVAIWPRGGEQPVGSDAKATFYDSIYHSLAVVGVNTSAQIEAAILGKSVHGVVDDRFEQESTLHFDYLKAENGGFVHIAPDIDRMILNLNSVAAQGGDEFARATAAFVSSFVRPQGTSRPSTDLLTEAIEEAARSNDASPALGQPGGGTVRALTELSANLDRQWLQIKRKRFAKRYPKLQRWLPEQLRQAKPKQSKLARARAKVPGFAGATSEILAGPWMGDVAGELLCWLPWLRDLCSNSPGARVIAGGTGSDPRWYSSIDVQYREIERHVKMVASANGNAGGEVHRLSDRGVRGVYTAYVAGKTRPPDGASWGRHRRLLPAAWRSSVTDVLEIAPSEDVRTQASELTDKLLGAKIAVVHTLDQAALSVFLGTDTVLISDGVDGVAGRVVELLDRAAAVLGVDLVTIGASDVQLVGDLIRSAPVEVEVDA